MIGKAVLQDYILFSFHLLWQLIKVRTDLRYCVCVECNSFARLKNGRKLRFPQYPNAQIYTTHCCTIVVCVSGHLGC